MIAANFMWFIYGLMDYGLWLCSKPGTMHKAPSSVRVEQMHGIRLKTEFEIVSVL